MDDSVAQDGGIRGAVAEIARVPGAVARLTSLPAGTRLDDHTHAHPYLSLHLLGAYCETGEGGATAIDGPAAAFHPAGSAHADAIGARGLTTVVIEFDPAWLTQAMAGRLPQRSTYWTTGRAAAGATRLARACLDPAGEGVVDRALAYLNAALVHETGPNEPVWLGRLDDLIEAGITSPETIARALRVSDPWLARAYRAWRGEGLAERLRRRRVETAVTLLEEGRLPLAGIAAEAGFCDQSHMNRVFLTVLARTPAQVRTERLASART